jgi:heme-degrading monooxygenase HmoA
MSEGIPSTRAEQSAQGSAAAGGVLRERSVPGSSPPFVVISQFTVANDKIAEVKEAFRNRPRQVDRVDGFLRLEAISPVDNPDQIWLITFWRDEACFQNWHQSHRYSEAHQGIPKDLKLVPNSVEIRYFQGVAH